MSAPLLLQYDKLLTQLGSQPLAAGYLIVGNEPLQLHEISHLIIETAQQQGFNEKVTETLSNQTDWQTLYLACNTLSLFSEKKLLHLTLPEGQMLTNTLQSGLEHLLADYLHPDILLLLQVPSLSRTQEKQQWFQRWPSASRCVKCDMPSAEQLPRWVRQRTNKLNLSFDNAALNLLCHHYEGNLLTLAQILDQLVLLYPDGKINVPRLNEVLFNMAIFTPYEWLNTLMQGKLPRSLKILRKLKENDTDPIYLLRILQKELLLLLQFKVMHPSIEAFFETHKIWQARRTLFLATQQRLTRTQIEQSLLELSSMECDTKQYHPEFIWERFERISLLLRKNN